ncbi:TetR/AcrR family transcriptional regulator [Kribbella sp. NBC_01245]|uniref:TetR/AcrR family transcriptional regulator n=1 Tax=Kribbella sp. NBC_01245 TaxID=2903578 RepID=UPI002E2D160A|nr:TetR/AcrR family transcriptional regulator [Kribbella sp. NBC_01245]
MSTSYEQSGRVQQKTRTRNELIAAARELIARGGATPTVEEAAAAASISRTTAYRYFPSQKALLAAAHPETEATSLLPEGIGDDPAVRLDAAVATFVRSVIESERQQRTMLRLSLDTDTAPHELPLRKGRAIAWFEDALSPLVPRLTAEGVHRLAVALRSATGIESLVWLTDVGGLSRDEAAETMKWTAQALLHHALTVAPPA